MVLVVTIQVQLAEIAVFAMEGHEQIVCWK